MPTGYTADIKDGISFRKFALNCARNFGAAIALRDESSDVEITPENVKFGGNYYQKTLTKAKLAKTKFDKLSQKQKRQLFKKETEKNINYCRQSDASMKAQKKSYLSMLEKVQKWNPPTKDHQNMKNFMISQIEESISFDCNTEYNNERIISAVTQTYSEWLKSKKEKLIWDIDYHKEQLAKETQRNDERSNWVKNLIDSLPTE